MKKNIKIVIADDHQMVRNGLKLMLQNSQSYQIELDECSNGIELMELLSNNKYDLILLDISMPEQDGMETLRKMKLAGMQTPVIILTMHSEENIIKKCYELGAKSYISKNSDGDELEKAISAVLKKQYYYSNEIAQVLLSHHSVSPQKKKKDFPLTDRELEVLKMIIQEKTNQEIADELFLSKRTVEGHRERIMSKLGIHSTIGLVKFAINQGIMQ